MTCNDSGYQAISFDVETHLPRVTDDCTGRPIHTIPINEFRFPRRQQWEIPLERDDHFHLQSFAKGYGYEQNFVFEFLCQ